MHRLSNVIRNRQSKSVPVSQTVCFPTGGYVFLHSSVARLGFLREDGGCQLLGVGDVRAPGHHPAHQLRGKDVAQVDVHFLPRVPVAAVCGGIRVRWHVGGGSSVGGHRKVSAVRWIRWEGSS